MGIQKGCKYTTAGRTGLEMDNDKVKVPHSGGLEKPRILMYVDIGYRQNSLLITTSFRVSSFLVDGGGTNQRDI